MKKSLFAFFLAFVIITVAACNDMPAGLVSSSTTVDSKSKSIESSSVTKTVSSDNSSVVSNEDSYSLSESSSSSIEEIPSSSSSEGSSFSSENSSPDSTPSSSSSSEEDRVPTNVDEQKLVDLISKFVLVENNTVVRDYIILPRVTSEEYGKITWITSNPSVIDEDGFVYQKDHDQTVSLTGTFALNSSSWSKTFVVTVKAKQTEKYQTITESDDRILRKVYVNNPSELSTAFNNAKAGDAIILNDGTYKDINVNLKKSGTEANPIFLFAKNPQSAKITGVSTVEVNADYAVVANLMFTDGNPVQDKGCVVFNGNNLRLTNVYVKNFEQKSKDYKWVSLTGKYHEIDNNTFDGKETGGALLTVWRNDDGAQYHYIHNNQFKNYKNAGGANGYETIRVGDSKQSQSDSFIMIENNLFEKVDGEIEIVSIKSGRTYVRGNTFVNSSGLVTARHGKNSVIENNVFFCGNVTGSGGVRTYDGGHLVRNNYVENAAGTGDSRGGIVVHSGLNQPGTPSGALSDQWTAYNIFVYGNTVYNSVQSILFGGKYAVAAKDVTVQNNFVVALSGKEATRYDKIPTNLVFMNNHFYSNKGYVGAGGKLTSKDIAIPNGVTFTNSLLSIPQNSEGLRLHETYGAKDLRVIDAGDTGAYYLR